MPILYVWICNMYYITTLLPYLTTTLQTAYSHTPSYPTNPPLSPYRFVISRILQPLDTEDPYADDYYYIQSQIKKNKKQQEIAAEEAKTQSQSQGQNMGQVPGGSGVPLPLPDLIVPLPTWKDAKEKLKMKVINSKMNITNRSKKWTVKEKTLGVQTRGMFVYGWWLVFVCVYAMCSLYILI